MKTLYAKMNTFVADVQDKIANLGKPPRTRVDFFDRLEFMFKDDPQSPLLNLSEAQRKVIWGYYNELHVIPTINAGIEKRNACRLGEEYTRTFDKYVLKQFLQ